MDYDMSYMQKKTLKSPYNVQKGFTLVETLVAIALLIVVITGAYTAAQAGLSGAILSKEEVAAFYLAQEGVEEIRNLRDNNGLAGSNWLTGIAQQATDNCFYGKACYVDATTNTVSTCSTPESCPTMRQDSVTGLYGYNSSWDLSPFTRTITLTQINSEEVSVLVTVTWSKGALNRSFHVRENILNWQ
jgi:prepilin-type N-terminal cleavage/methylation domain-containing protein